MTACMMGSIVTLCSVAFPARAAENEARVLILNGADPYLPAYVAVDAAMRASLAEETARRIVFFSETLDAQRFSMEALEPEYVALLTKKYAALRFDVVVVVAPTALAFFRRHGEQLWPGARVVYQGFREEEMEREALPPNAIGVIARPDAAGAVEIALQLQPNARPTSWWSPDSRRPQAERVEVRQVILNLVLNAMDAMRDRPADQRVLTIRSRRENSKEAEVSVADFGAWDS